jgi:hypothetical protein
VRILSQTTPANAAQTWEDRLEELIVDSLPWQVEGIHPVCTRWHDYNAPADDSCGDPGRRPGERRA